MTLAYINTLKITTMKTFEKIYIGKGKQVNDLRIVRVSLKIEDILEHAHDYKGEKFITFEVAALQNPDKFGNGYTVYVSKLVESEASKVAEPVKTTENKEKKSKKAPKKAAKKQDTENTEIPF